jgi:RNA polymerase sigma-70 factor (ECF subfamily)
MHNSITQDSSRLLQQEEEAQLVGEAKANPESFAKLYDCYAPNIYRYLLSRLGNVAGAQDVTSQTFLRAFEMFPRYRHTGYFSAWLFTIARRKAIAAYRRQRPNLSLEEAENVPGVAEDPLERVIRGEQRERMAALFAGLNEDQRELLHLRFTAGLSYVEIGALLRRSKAAVKMAIYRLLHQMYAKWEEKR